MPGRGRPPKRLRRGGEHQPVKVKDLACSLPAKAWRTITWREGTNAPLKSRFARLRIRIALRDFNRSEPWPEEWLLIEWPKGEKEPTKYWLSNLPGDTDPATLVRLGKIRWRIEHDYRELKTGLGLDHFEGRSFTGWHRHVTLVSAAHLFITTLRQDPKAAAPA